MKKPDPRNYIANLDKNTSRIEELIRQYFEDYKNGNLYREFILRNIWKQTVGTNVWKQTKKIYEKDGTLFIKISSPAAKSEVMMRKNNIIERFNSLFETYGVINKIVLL